MTPEGLLSNRNEPSKKRRLVNRATTFVAGLAVGVGGTLSTQALTQPHETPVVKPGGMWESPLNGATVGNTIHFAARAYPTDQQDPQIAYVNFTAQVKGVWQVACHVPPPPPQVPSYTCDWEIPPQFRDSPQIIVVSFDVYDQKGNSNKAPNGLHTVFKME